MLKTVVENPWVQAVGVVIAVCLVCVLCYLLKFALLSGTDAELTPIGHGLYRVNYDINQHLPNLVGIYLDIEQADI